MYVHGVRRCLVHQKLASQTILCWPGISINLAYTRVEPSEDSRLGLQRALGACPITNPYAMYTAGRDWALQKKKQALPKYFVDHQDKGPMRLVAPSMLTTSVALLHCSLSLAGTCVSMTALWGENKTCSGGYMKVLQNRCFLHALKTCEVWVLVLPECWHTASPSFNLSPILREEADGQQVQRAQVSGRQCSSLSSD